MNKINILYHIKKIPAELVNLLEKDLDSIEEVYSIINIHVEIVLYVINLNIILFHCYIIFHRYL